MHHVIQYFASPPFPLSRGGLHATSLLLHLVRLSSSMAATVLAPFNPTSDDAIKVALGLLGEVTEDDVVFDLGCGDARFLIAACAEFGTGIGVELDPELAKPAEKAVADAGLQDRITIKCQDACAVDFSSATVLLLYLVPKGLALLAPKLNALAASPHSVRVVANFFSVPGWTPTASHMDARSRVHFYAVGGAADGAAEAASAS